MLISPLPLFGLPLFDELAGPLAYKGYDAFKFRTIAGMPGTNPDAAEGWANVPEVLEETLQRLAPYRRIVVLSGDVHYAHSAEVSYWVAGDEAATPLRPVHLQRLQEQVAGCDARAEPRLRFRAGHVASL